MRFVVRYTGHYQGLVYHGARCQLKRNGGRKAGPGNLNCSISKNGLLVTYLSLELYLFISQPDTATLKPVKIRRLK